MAKVRDAARITVAGMASDVTHSSPLEDQAQLVFQAAKRYAEIHRFPRSLFEGRQGRKGPLTMKSLIWDLFPQADREMIDIISGLVGQVLKKTYAARCIIHSADPSQTPIWWISDTMPENIVVVAIAVRTGSRVPRTGEFTMTPTHTERRLTPHEAGEDRPPAPVLRGGPRTEQGLAARQEALQPSREQKMAEFRANLNHTLEVLRVQTQPVSAEELQALVDRDGLALHDTTVRNYLKRLIDMGEAASRRETAAERAVRAGGPGKAKRAHLFSTTNPVPPRTERIVVDGVSLRSAQEIFEASRTERDDNAERVLDTLARLNKRTPTGLLLKAVNASDGPPLTEREMKDSLDYLRRMGLVFKDKSYRYGLEDWTRRTRRAPAATKGSEMDSTPTPTETPVEAPREAPAPPRASTMQEMEGLLDPRVTQIIDLLTDLASDAQLGSRKDENDQRNEERIIELEAEVARLKQALAILAAS